MDLWNEWGLPVIVVGFTAGLAVIVARLVGHWIDRQEEAAKHGQEIDKS